MTRSRIGPLALEAPLGGSGSKLFRAIHVQQRSQVAVRVFSMPMGMTPEGKQEFAGSLERIKTLKHPGIVRCYGGGFDAKDAYLVYELVEGESLDVLLDRRERLPWETVLDYGLQLCDALHKAHESGWVHGRVRPDKVLLTLGGEVAKLNEVWPGPRAPTPPQPLELVYQAPEQIETQKNTVASDLYGLGATLYHALTGQAPFAGGNAGMVREAVLSGNVPPVATLVFDCPVWLSAIVEHLMNRDPLKRPYSAVATSMALREAQKRATSGVAVVQHAVSGFSPLQMKADKEEAEKALGRKPKKSKRKRGEDGVDDSPTLLERPAVLFGLLLAIVGVIGYLLMPLSEKTLRSRAEIFIAQGDVGSLNEARDRYLIPLLERFPQSSSAQWAEERLIEIEMVNAEQRMQSNRRFGREPSSEGERRFTEANRFEQFGDRVTALDKYRAIIHLLRDEESERPFVNLARRQIQKIEDNPPDTDELRRFLQEKLDEADRKYGQGDVLSAKQTWEGIVSLYDGNKEMVSQVERAQNRLAKIKDQ